MATSTPAKSQIHWLRRVGFLVDSFEKGAKGFSTCQRARKNVAVYKVSHPDAHFITFLTWLM